MEVMIQEKPLQEIEFDSLVPDKTIVILLSGKAGTGKTLSANLICNILDSLRSFDYEIYSIAKGVKDIARDSFDWDGLKGDKGRRLLQDVGRVGRRYDKDIWIRKMVDDVYSHVVLHDFVIVDDWRFPNEFDYFSGIGDFNLCTIRLEAPKREILKGTPAYDDVSETSLRSVSPEDIEKYYNFVVNNSGGEEELKASLTRILLTILRNGLRVW